MPFQRAAIDPNGTVSSVLGTLGGTIGAGVFLGRIDTKVIDAASGGLIGAAIGATAAVFGGLLGAVVVKGITKAKTQKGPQITIANDTWWQNGLVAVVGAALGCAAGFAVVAGFGLIDPRIFIIKGWFIAGLVTGGISGLLDSVVF